MELSDLWGSVEPALKLAAIPSGVMLLLSITMYKVTVPKSVVSALQHAAAGIVLSAISTELIPPLQDAPNTKGTIIGISVGFCAALIVFFLLSAFCGDDDDDDDDNDSFDGNHDGVTTHGHVKSFVAEGVRTIGDDVNESQKSPGMAKPGLPAQREDTFSAMPASIQHGTPYRERRVASPEPTHPSNRKSKIGYMEYAKRWVLKRRNPEKEALLPKQEHLDRTSGQSPPGEDGGVVTEAIPPFPLTLVAAVIIDAFVDGFLIGISTASGSSAGVIMTAALTIEMGFLGMTFACTISQQRLSKSLPAICAPPLFLVIGAAIGSGSAAAVAHLPSVHIGLLAFGTAALLYLVTEELLLEAHENMEGHRWWIDIWFFLGFLASFIFAKLTAD